MSHTLLAITLIVPTVVFTVCAITMFVSELRKDRAWTNSQRGNK